MEKHIYLSLVPEALIASQLTPDEFGAYYACGTQRKARGQAMFIEIDPAFRSREFRIEEGLNRCIPHEKGEPKSSIYISVYRIAERIPVSALGSLYLVTNDGRTAELPKRVVPSDTLAGGLHLYQELSPTRPLVASTLPPLEFYKYMTASPENLFSIPALYFVDLRLGALAEDPEFGGCEDLPYENIDHLRQCLVEIRATKAETKIVDRNHSIVFPYRLVDTGFYFGSGKDMAFYQMPTKAEMLNKYYNWWRSSQV